MTKNERTSKKVARIAARIVAAEEVESLLVIFWGKAGSEYQYIPGEDIRALAASALTQAPDRTPRKSRTVAKTRKGTICDVHPPKRKAPKVGKWTAKNHKHREHLEKKARPLPSPKRKRSV